MGTLFAHTRTLTAKNLRILSRQWISTVVRALILPVALVVFLGLAKNLLVPPSVVGFGHVNQILFLPEALKIAANSGRSTVVGINSFPDASTPGYSQVEEVMHELQRTVEGAGFKFVGLNTSEGLSRPGGACPSSFFAVSNCYGVVNFFSNPEGGLNHGSGIWNYTLMTDASLHLDPFDVHKKDNVAQIYGLPFKHAIDRAIASTWKKAANSDLIHEIPEIMEEWMFTMLNQDESDDQKRKSYLETIDWQLLGATFIMALLGVCYHMVGFMSTERETGMATLMDSMMSTRHAWEAQAARFLSHHAAFSLVYLPGWVITSLVFRLTLFKHADIAVLMLQLVLTGLALSSASLLGAAFFKKSEKSGVYVSLALVLLSILAENAASWPINTTIVIVLIALFTPCNFVFFIHYLSHWEFDEKVPVWSQPPPVEPMKTVWQVPGYVFLLLLVAQIVCYPVLGALLERWVHGTASYSRTVVRDVPADEGKLTPGIAVQLRGFCKTYEPSVIRKLLRALRLARPKESVRAVQHLDLQARQGEILFLLGANGSGKTTTLDSIAGMQKATSGTIVVDGSGGVGIAPQRNVHWERLTVEEHIKVFNRLKSPRAPATEEDLHKTVVAVDLEMNAQAFPRMLSGGQKRKLQLGIMLTGGSAVCCVDEVSSGLDPISRRKVWDILLAEQGRRTLIMTTHYLDEVDYLADHIAILSKGTLRAEGSSAELKERLGHGYRIHIHDAVHAKNMPRVEGVVLKTGVDGPVYLAPTSSLAAKVLAELGAAGLDNYTFSGPTIEDAFLKFSDEVSAEYDDLAMARPKQELAISVVSEKGGENTCLNLVSGGEIGPWCQTRTLFWKRWVIFKRHWSPWLVAFLIPVVVAILASRIVRSGPSSTCDASTTEPRDYTVSRTMVFGPESKINNDTVERFLGPVASNLNWNDPANEIADDEDWENEIGEGWTAEDLESDLTVEDEPVKPSNSSVGQSSLRRRDAGNVAPEKSQLLAPDLASVSNYSNGYEIWERLVREQHSALMPGAAWVGDSDHPVPVVAYQANMTYASAQLILGLTTQNLLNSALANHTIYTLPAVIMPARRDNVVQPVLFFVLVSLALCAYPSFFSLYPTLERTTKVRALHYSSGVRRVSIWSAHLAFDFLIVLLSSALVTIIFWLTIQNFYGVGFIFVIFTLYGVCAICQAYLVSLFCKSQLAAYAFTMAIPSFFLLAYILAYFLVLTYVPFPFIEPYLNAIHFTIATFSPLASVLRALFLGLNFFWISCVTGEMRLSSDPGGFLYYGGPTLFLCLQSIVLFATLLWVDRHISGGSPKRCASPSQAKEASVSDEEMAVEDDGLPVMQPQLDGASASAGENNDGLRAMHLTKIYEDVTAVDNVSFEVKPGEVFALLGPNGAGKSTTFGLIRGDIPPTFPEANILLEGISIIEQPARARTQLGVCPQFDAVDRMTVLEHLRLYARIRGVPDVEHNVSAVIRAVGLGSMGNRQAHKLSGGNRRKLSLGVALIGNPKVLLLDEPSSGLDAAAKRIMWRTLTSMAPDRAILLTTHSMEEAEALASRVGILAKRMLAVGATDQLRRRFGGLIYVHLVCQGAPHTPIQDVRRICHWIAATFPGAAIEENTYHGQVRFSVSQSAMPNGPSKIGQLVLLLEGAKEELGVEYYSVSPGTLDQVFLTVVEEHNVEEEGAPDRKKSWWTMSSRGGV